MIDLPSVWSRFACHFRPVMISEPQSGSAGTNAKRLEIRRAFRYDLSPLNVDRVYRAPARPGGRRYSAEALARAFKGMVMQTPPPYPISQRPILGVENTDSAVWRRLWSSCPAEIA